MKKEKKAESNHIPYYDLNNEIDKLRDIKYFHPDVLNKANIILDNIKSLKPKEQGIVKPETIKWLEEWIKKHKDRPEGDIEIDQESLKILHNPDLIELLCDEAQKKIVGERDTIKAIHICANGRNVQNHNIASYNLLVNSDSGSGKDFVVSNTLEILPETEYIKKTRISPAVFNYWHNSKNEPSWTWNKKVFYCEDISNNVLNSDVFKVMCSSGSNATILINQEAVDIEIRGKPVIITTTTQAQPSKETIRRFAIVSLNETKNQTEAIMQRIAETEAEGIIINPNEQLRRALSFLRMVKVKVPYLSSLVKYFPKNHLIMRTHFPRFIDLIKSSASLYQNQRQKDEQGVIIAQGQDYDLAREVLLKMTSNPYMIPLTAEQRKFLQVFEDLKDGKRAVKKYKCSNCELICDTKECPKCYDFADGKRVKFPTIDYNLSEFSIQDLEPLMTFFTGTDRWLRKQLDVLVSYGFLARDPQKRATSDKPYQVYSYINLPILNIPGWIDISSNGSDSSDSSITSNSSNSHSQEENKEAFEPNEPFELKKQGITSIEEMTFLIGSYGSPGCPKSDFISKYGQETLDLLLMQGLVIENPSGILRLIE